MKTLKIKSALVICTLALSTLVSCKKENAVTPETPAAPVAKTIYGSWTGKYGSGNNAPETFYSFNIKPEGLLEVKDQQGKVTGLGSWELADEATLSATYSYSNTLNITYTVNAKYDKEAEMLNGSWSASTGFASGEFFMNKD